MNWTYAVLGAFASVFAVNALLITLSLRTPAIPMETGSPYEQSLHYQSELEAESRFLHLAGSSWSLECDRQSATLLLKAPKVPTNNGWKAEVDALRADSTGLDFKRSFQWKADGLWSAPIPLGRLREGVWLARVRWTHPKNPEMLLKTKLYCGG